MRMFTFKTHERAIYLSPTAKAPTDIIIPDSPGDGYEYDFDKETWVLNVESFQVELTASLVNCINRLYDAHLNKYSSLERLYWPTLQDEANKLISGEKDIEVSTLEKFARSSNMDVEDFALKVLDNQKNLTQFEDSLVGLQIELESQIKTVDSYEQYVTVREHINAVLSGSVSAVPTETKDVESE